MPQEADPSALRVSELQDRTLHSGSSREDQHNPEVHLPFNQSDKTRRLGRGRRQQNKCDKIIFVHSQHPTCLHSGHHPQEARHQEEDFSIERFLMEIKTMANGKHASSRDQPPYQALGLPTSSSDGQLLGQYGRVTPLQSSGPRAVWVMEQSPHLQMFMVPPSPPPSWSLYEMAFKVPPGQMYVFLNTWFGTHQSGL